MTYYNRLILGTVCVWRRCSLTLQLHKVGTQPAASSRAVAEVVEGEEVGGAGPGGPGGSVAGRQSLQLAVCDWLARVHAGETGHLWRHMTWANFTSNLIDDGQLRQQSHSYCLKLIYHR